MLETMRVFPHLTVMSEEFEAVVAECMQAPRVALSAVQVECARTS